MKAELHSCLYRCRVMHNRLSPKKHAFHYDVYFFYIDLDEVDELAHRFPLISHNRFNFFSFRDKEHLQLPAGAPDHSKNLRQHIEDYLALNNIAFRGGRIMLLTNMNVLGYQFNPVSFYFCFDDAGEVQHCIVEVSNTFREMKPYLIAKENLSGNTFHLNTKKYFYVSPFIDMDTDFGFRITVPDEKLDIRIDDYKDGERFFISTLTGARRPLTNTNLVAFGLRFPVIPLQVMTLIHWNALRLWLRKLPFHRKDENRHLQQNVYKARVKHGNSNLP